MLRAATHQGFSDAERSILDLVVPADHYLRLVRAKIDFERFRGDLEQAYSPLLGRPAWDPVLMLKILFLCFHYQLTDAAVMQRIQTDLAFRWFLDLPLAQRPPDSSALTYFRQRIGAERFTAIFQTLVRLAREQGLVSDRLRLKDATHMYANAADTVALTLLAQVRDRLLRAAEAFFAEFVAQKRQQLQQLRASTAELPGAERFQSRLEFLRQLTEQLPKLLGSLPASSHPSRKRLEKALSVAAKLLADQSQSAPKDRLISGIDDEARLGKHGEFYRGYSVDLSMDADSELITAINVLPANGAEAADAIDLIAQEENAQGNDVQGLSIDGAGYNGPVLRTLMAPDGLNLDVTVPVPQTTLRPGFAPDRFSLTVIDENTAELKCPHDQTTRRRERIDRDTGYKYRFRAAQCSACPLRRECLANPDSSRARQVTKNDYEAEYRRVEQKVGTAAYEQTRKTHSKVERKLGEMARHHGARQARYRGRAKAQIQATVTGWVINVKRIVQLLCQKMKAAFTGKTLRAEMA